MQHYDIIIIGGGAAGLMAAYGAKTSGKDVSVHRQRESSLGCGI